MYESIVNYIKNNLIGLTSCWLTYFKASIVLCLFYQLLIKERKKKEERKHKNKTTQYILTQNLSIFE